MSKRVFIGALGTETNQFVPFPTGLRGYQALEYSFHEAGIMLRLSGDTIELTPPFIISEAQIGELVEKVARTIKAVA